MDVPCIGCGTNLRGKFIGGGCGVCDYGVAASIRDDIAAALDVELDQVEFIQAALREHRFRRKQRGESTPKHMNAREVCIAVRDHAVNLSRSSEDGKALLVELGITSSEQVGKVIYGMVGRGLLEATQDDRPEQFDGLFTLDELMTAPAIKRDKAIG